MEDIMTYAQLFFGWLMQATLIASVVTCLILLIQKMLGGKLGPRWCHALWLVLLIRMILPWAPSSRVSLFNLIPSWDRQIQRAQPSKATEQQGSSQAAQASETAEAIPAGKSESDVTIQKRVIPEPGAIADIQIESQPWLVSLRRVLPVLWLAGAVVIGTYLLMSNFALWRIVKRDRPLVKQAMLELFEECKAQMGVQSLVAVVPSNQIRSPGLFGFVRPRLLLPLEMLDTATSEEMRYVFLHELAHLRRHDIYFGWLTSLLQVLHWFNPLVWFAFYRMRADRELACDALVLARTQKEESQEYGQAIVGLVRRFSRSRPLPAMAGILESKSQLKRRITMITQFKKNSYQWSPLAVILIIILACVSLPDARRTKASETSAAKPSAIVVRRVWAEAPNPFYTGAPSPDGKYLAYSDWDGLIDGGPPLAVLELATGKTRHLTKTGSWTPFSPIFSPDSKQVAYAWHNPENKVMELRIVGLDGSEPRVLHSDREVQVFRPADWSAD
ncbi:MAG: M56 family metallopeptidase, partial [Sedimentisphaerales bacterium]